MGERADAEKQAHLHTERDASSSLQKIAYRLTELVRDGILLDERENLVFAAKCLLSAEGIDAESVDTVIGLASSDTEQSDNEYDLGE